MNSVTIKLEVINGNSSDEITDFFLEEVTDVNKFPQIKQNNG